MGCRAIQSQQPRQKKSNLRQAYPAQHGTHTPVCCKADVWSLFYQDYSTQQKSGTKDWWCASVVLQSQLLQAHSIHKSKVARSSLLQRPSVTFTFISLKQAMSLLDPAVVFPFSLARFLSSAFQGGSLCLFLSPCILNYSLNYPSMGYLH